MAGADAGQPARNDLAALGDKALQQTHTRLQASRQTELEILTDVEIRNLVASQGIRLIDYGFVAGKA